MSSLHNSTTAECVIEPPFHPAVNTIYTVVYPFWLIVAIVAEHVYGFVILAMLSLKTSVVKKSFKVSKLSASICRVPKRRNNGKHQSITPKSDMPSSVESDFPERAASEDVNK